jgi:hypothetical protein
MKLEVPTLTAQQAKIQTIDIGQVVIGPITVGELVLNNANFTISSANGVLTGTSIEISIQISVEWAIHIGLPWPFSDIDIGDTYNLGSIGFGPIPLGNIVIPGLNNIQLNIPSLIAQQISIAPNNPVTLHMVAVLADNIKATDSVLPSQGFSLSGMSLASIDGSGLAIPAAKVSEVAISHLQGNPVQIPTFTLGNMNMAVVHIPNISSSLPLDIPAILPTQSLGFNAGILLLCIHLTPSVEMHIAHLEINNANASATVGSVTLKNVNIPYDLMNLKLADIGIKTLKIPSFHVA